MAAAKQHLKILNVDDREVNRYIRTETLQRAGYQVIEAATGKEALERFEAESPQLILLDMNLPDIPGEEVCRRIRARPDPGSVIVLHISAARTSVEDRVFGLKGGADGYLVEPVEPELLLATVQSMLRLWTAETRLEESLTQTRGLAAKYQSLIEAVPHVIFTATADGGFDYISEQFQAYTNFSAKEAFGAGWLEFVHPADREPAGQLWSHSVETGEPFETEYRLRHMDGAYRWNLSRARAVRNTAGRVVQWVGSVTDVHERKLLEEEVKLRHREFVALAEHSPDTIARLDPELRYTYVNRGVAGVSPARPEQYMGKTNRELGWPPGLCDRWEEGCRVVLTTRLSTHFEFRCETESEKVSYYHARIVPEFAQARLGKDEPVESLLSITTDITDRREAELAVAESERRLLRLVESNVIGIVIGNGERITFANDVFLQLVGYTQDDVRAGSMDWRAMTPPEYRALDDRGLEELKERGACTPFEKEFLRKDGARVPILIGAAALDSPVTEWACFVLDMTELKNAEAALRKTNLALQRSNTDLAQFAYAASHDLQEPLRTVAIYTELLARQRRGGFSSETDKHIEFIQDAVTRMQNLIRSLLAFSHVQNGEYLAGKAIPAGDMIADAMANLKNAVEESGAVLTWGNLPAISADLAHFTLVFQNLISNAIKYRKPGEPPRIGIAAEREGESWTFSVRDNGIGFEQEYAERIFTPFTRLHGREFPGTGIGLALVKRIIERHEGQVWAAGEPGVGATFFFRLPIR